MDTQLWEHGSAESAKPSMDKEDLIAYLNLVMIILATLMGYIAGSYRG